jgi:hypoxanthine phosphoribosyltransferase
MARKEYYSVGKVKGLVLDLIKQMYQDTWKPDYIVGINRGGLTPAVMISHFMDLPMYALDVRLRQGGEPESNTMMPLDALEGKQILIVDDINDSGATFNWIINDWTATLSPTVMHNARPHAPPEQLILWRRNIKFAVLTENLASEFNDVNYCVEEVNKVEDDVWIVFPWEQWWGINYEEQYNE